jgi:hypothetical protein
LPLLQEDLVRQVVEETLLLAEEVQRKMEYERGWDQLSCGGL